MLSKRMTKKPFFVVCLKKGGQKFSFGVMKSSSGYRKARQLNYRVILLA